MKDRRGLEITVEHADAGVAADDFAARLLRLDRGVDAILDAVQRWPQTPILQLYAAAFWLYGQTDEARNLAAARLTACASLSMNPREKTLHRALELWHANDNLRAVEALESITAEWPRDLVTAKCAEFLYYVLGQEYMGTRFREHVTRLESLHDNDPDFLAMAAFANELCGGYDVAESHAERALGLEPRNPWAQHALSHVLIRQGRVREGRARMEAFLPQLRTCGRPIHSHDAWHLALLYLEDLDVAATLRIFHEHIWGITPDFVVEQLDAIALLWRIELSGTPLDAQWPSIAKQIVPRAGETFMPFMNAHYVYALARAGRIDVLEPTLAKLHARSEMNDEEGRRVWRSVGLAVVEAAAASGGGDHIRAVALLDPVMPMITAIGGSDAQIDLFRQTYVRSLRAAGRRSDATAYFEQMTLGKHCTALDRVFAS